MLLGYAAVGAGIAIFFLLALSSLVTGILAGYAVYARRSSLRGMCMLMTAIGCVIVLAMLMSRGINPELFSDASNRRLVIPLLGSGIPIGVVLGLFARVFRAALNHFKAPKDVPTLVHRNSWGDLVPVHQQGTPAEPLRGRRW